MCEIFIQGHLDISIPEYSKIHKVYLGQQSRL